MGTSKVRHYSAAPVTSLYEVTRPEVSRIQKYFLAATKAASLVRQTFAAITCAELR